jgi:SPP1 gp7 family putative phage head morphogenesis protein
VSTNANTAIYDKLVDRAAMLRLYEERVAGKVTTIIDGHKVRIIDIILANKAKMTPKMREEIDIQLRKTYGNAFNTSSKSLMDLVNDQLSYTYQKMDNVVGKIWRTAKPNYRISEDIVLKRPLYNDVTLMGGWTSVSIAERKRLESLIRRGIAEGLDEKAIALSVRDGNVFTISKQQSIGLVRTAITSVRSQTDHEVYKANEKILTGWQYVAVLDSRTTPLCQHRDGTVYPISDTAHLPPAHWYCRSTTIPITKSYDQLGELEGVAQIRKRNLEGLTQKQIAFYDGQTPLKESYSEWLQRQPTDVQLRHLGDNTRLELFRSGQLTVDKFTTPAGNSVGINELRRMTDDGYGIGNTKKFAIAKEQLDRLKLGAARPEELIDSPDMVAALRNYYMLQAKDLDGNLSLTNYRGNLLHTKKATKARVLNSPPTEEQLLFNPLTGRYDDSRIFQPNQAVLKNNLRLVEDSVSLKRADKDFIKKFVDDLDGHLGANERAVITDNLRIVFTRFRDNKEPWTNLKAVLNGQIKFDIMNVSDYIETQLRRDQNFLLKLKQDMYIDPVLGPVQLQDLHDNFIANIRAKNKWEDSVAPKIARELRNIFDYKIPYKIRTRLKEDGDHQLDQFYLRFANRLAMADSPDRDQLAVALGRDLYNAANYRGNRKEWWLLGNKLLDNAKAKGFYELETRGVQKRRMRSRNFGKYFGPAYDTNSVVVVVHDPRILEYAKLTRKVDVGLRVSATTEHNRLRIREGYKTYFTDEGLFGYYDTRIPIISESSFKDFPEKLIDKDMTSALNWAAQTKYKVDPDFHDFIDKLLHFTDDKGRAKYYSEVNHYREYMSGRGDAYERFKAMSWLRAKDSSFSNHPFLDHRARIYERGFIGPQAGESFRPFLNSAVSKKFNEQGYLNLQDQIGGFIGGLSDNLEGKYNALSVLGRQEIAKKHRPEMVKIGYHMLRGKPADIRAVLDSKFVQEIDGEDLGKALRLSLEMAKIDRFLDGDYSDLSKLKGYDIAVALEQDASSSGAQIIALTTKNKQLAELSNVLATNQKKRLYDEIAALTFNDPRFIKLNQKLGLTEKDLRKASKAQNMVTFYGAGQRTGAMNVETKLAKALGKNEGLLVVKASERDKVLDEIAARAARFERFDPDTASELKALRQDVKDIFNRGVDPGDDLLEDLWFLEPKTYEFVEKLSRSYDKVVTPNDFKLIAEIMSENLAVQVPILKDFTRYFGRLAEDFLTSAKPNEASFDEAKILRQMLFGAYKAGDKLPPRVAELLGTKASESISEKFLKRVPWYKPGDLLSEVIYGVKAPLDRRTGTTLGKVKFKLGAIEETLYGGFDVLYPNKMPKQWTNIPWVNFDGKVIEQNFTQAFEERLVYRDANGDWVTNILMIKQKTDPTWWEEFRNKTDTMRDIADVNKARTAFAVNGNHANDATLVKQYHLWGRKNNIPTATVHDAFMANAADLLKSRDALREIYANVLDKNVILDTLNEMRDRGLSKELYDKYLNEAIDIGLIPIAGRSVVGGKKLQESDILKKSDVLVKITHDFKGNHYWYGIG